MANDENLEDIMQSVINRLPKTNAVLFPSYEIPRIFKFIET